MQSAVVGQNGTLSYRLNLDGFPGSGWAFCYFAELEDLGPNETRKFRLMIPGMSAEYSKASVNVQENAQGRFRLYEPGYPNISFPFTLSFEFVKTIDSTRGPILNAFEINKYVQISAGSQDASNAAALCSHYPLATWAQEGGDPCLPVPWSWVKCTSDQQPRIVTVNLSGRNLTGNVSSELSTLTGITELWLDNNSFTGPIPDLSGCINLKIIHLENNFFTGEIPAYLAALPNLSELYLQNNRLSGVVPPDLLHKNIVLNYSGNTNLHIERDQKVKLIIIGVVIGIFFLLITAMFIYCCLLRARGEKKKTGKVELVEQMGAAPSLPAVPSLPAPPSEKAVSVFSDAATEGSHCFTLAEIETATGKFVKKVGSGGFGSVFYGKLNDGKEIAVKVLSANSYQGKREFSNEVSLLSRIHHRNLVAFLGYCQEEGKSILVYEFMHNGTLKEHLYGPLTQEKSVSWTKRLEIAQDAAKGIEYLHTGCVPTIIHRDLKTSNILLDKNMRAKVSDFGLSKVAIDGSTHVSSIVRGTVGYLDPEYYISQQLTEKSDVYSFGVILLELISGQEAISNDSFGANCRNIVQWAKLHIESGDIQQIIDPSLHGEFDIQSVWKIAEKAMMCVQPHGRFRPTISEVLKEIQEAISIERGGSGSGGEDDFDMLSRNSRHSSINVSPLELAVSDSYLLLDESVVLPTAR
ncbi:putative LRR receptor-like serine/threonine-protein kinase [Nymphaea thermarum]|nr:putative LRR receptor-like serine/threonine-protein kinase [Nymphaea thermarum]